MPIVDWAALGKGLLRATEHALPANAGMFLGTVAGDRTPITSHDLGAQDMNALQRAAADAMALGIHSTSKATAKDVVMGYPNYPTSHEDVDTPGWGSAIKRSFTDPGYRMQTLIGMARLHRDAQGNTHVVDNYDFNPDGPGARIVHSDSPAAALTQMISRPTKVLDALGYMVAPDSAKDRRKVDINLGLVKPSYLGQTAPSAAKLKR